ncbi:MAG TPA: hypothetical protein VGK56_18850 [Anaerolineales bacterium]
MDEFGTNTVQGELIIGSVVHGAMINCMIVPHGNPDDWFFMQFPTAAAIEEFAIAHNLIMKRPENGNSSDQRE